MTVVTARPAKYEGSTGTSPQFRPFYSAVSRRFGVMGEAAFSAALGLAYVLVRAAAVGLATFTDWSLFLALLISVSAAVVFYATRVLARVVARLHTRIDAPAPEIAQMIGRDLTFRQLVIYGIAFGLLNAVFGEIFGVPTADLASALTLILGFTLVGFICGVAVAGILDVIRLIDFAAGRLRADYTAPDGCGGTLFLGNAIVRFSFVTLLMGVLISVYIVKAPWTHSGVVVWLLKWLWIILPYALAATVLAVPMSAVSWALSEYKAQQDDALERQLEALRQRIAGATLTGGEKDELRKEYEYFGQLRRQVFAMSTWPMRLASSVRYGGLALGHLFVSALTVRVNDLMNIPH